MPFRYFAQSRFPACGVAYIQRNACLPIVDYLEAPPGMTTPPLVSVLLIRRQATWFYLSN